MGSSAAYSLARRAEGHMVTLLDQTHVIRSSWGQERASRTAYDEELCVSQQLPPPPPPLSLQQVF